MIHDARRSSVMAGAPEEPPNDWMIEGRATAVIISSRPARNTPTDRTASSSLDGGRSMGPMVRPTRLPPTLLHARGRPAGLTSASAGA